MKYRVVFRERADKREDSSENPVGFLQNGVSNGVVLHSVFLLRNEPNAQKASESLEEDDFRSLGTEVWEYEVADGRDQDFKDALLNSGVVIEFERIGDLASDLRS